MESRFKFRAWDSIAKEYIFDSYALYELFVNDLDDSYQVEQCTGLRDKNGKLIYEGDIVRVDSKVYYIDPLTLVVGFHNGAFMVGDRFIDNNSKFMEIIGNIHENPELLEGNK